MPLDAPLTPGQLTKFALQGVLRLPGLLPPDPVQRAREAVLRQMDKLGLRRDGAWSLEDKVWPVWPATGVKPARDIGHRHPEVEALIKEPALMAVVDALLGGRPFDHELYRRPQVLCSLPNLGPWALPGGWHSDSPRLACGESPGVQMFTFLEPVEPRGGGTLVVAGSHRLLNDRGDLTIKDLNRLLRQEPFFRELYRETGGDALPQGRVGDIPLRVVELTGEPGDVWIVDLRILHAAAPNASERPRIMATHRFVRADLMPALAAAFGWS